MIWKEDEKRTKSFLLIMAVLFALLFLRFFDGEVNRINGTMMAFSYKYGFVSRGLIGSIYLLLDQILPFDIMNYTWMYRFTFAVTMVYYAVLFFFLHLCLKRCRTSAAAYMKSLMIFFVLFAVPVFCSEYNFGRLDVYCVMLSLLGAMLVIAQKWEWLLIPISALGVMVHQGNVFMFLNIILILLFYRVLSTKGREQKKYIIIFAGSFLVASVLFLYFELFSHFNGEEIYDDIVSLATALCKDGDYHVDVIDKEILGIDLTSREVKWHKYNIVQFPFFVLFMLPYIIMVVRFFRGLIRSAATREEKWKYIFVAIGSATILPDMLLKVDYGRWMFSIICYYMVVILALLAMRDTAVEDQVKLLIDKTKQKPWAALLLVYPIVFQPLGDVNICDLTDRIGQFLNTNLLHWW